jgi:brefeldin A-resistance guanine nucleotide exchange factor 1
MLQVEDFLSGTTSIPLKPKNIAPSRQQPRRDGSLLSTLSSYLLSPYSNDETYRADPTEEEVESTMCAVDCVAACRLEELFNDIR